MMLAGDEFYPDDVTSGPESDRRLVVDTRSVRESWRRQTVAEVVAIVDEAQRKARSFTPCDCIYSPNPGDCDHKSAAALNGAARVAPGARSATADPIPVGRPVHADAKPGPPNAGPAVPF